jgi:segregation and condensation protein A
MPLSITSQPAGTYKVTTPIYQGPLDLLLQLIERAELDITKLALAQITDQYLEHLRDLPEHVAEEVSAFLVIAAKLLQIKSEALLPRQPIREAGEEDPGEVLVQQLRAYKKFKEAAGHLSERENAGLRTYLRLAPPPKIEHKVDMSDLGLEDLLTAARLAFAQAKDRPELATVVSAPRVTIREKISHIRRFMNSGERVTFTSLLGKTPTRLDVVVTFLALLELIKGHYIRFHQEELFGVITFEPAEAWEDELDIELEFGE